MIVHEGRPKPIPLVREAHLSEAPSLVEQPAVEALPEVEPVFDELEDLRRRRLAERLMETLPSLDLPELVAPADEDRARRRNLRGVVIGGGSLVGAGLALYLWYRWQAR